MAARQTVLPKRLLPPGPDAAQLQALFDAAAAAPDHGQLQPWRFVRVPSTQRARLAEVFAQALIERDPLATEAQLARAREKAFRAPELCLLVVNATKGDGAVDVNERLLSAGCAVQNLLLLATAMGLGSALTSGRALKSSALRTCFGLAPGELAVCFVSLGTVGARQPGKTRPLPADFVSTLGDEPHSVHPPCCEEAHVFGHL